MEKKKKAKAEAMGKTATSTTTTSVTTAQHHGAAAPGAPAAAAATTHASATPHAAPAVTRILETTTTTTTTSSSSSSHPVATSTPVKAAVAATPEKGRTEWLDNSPNATTPRARTGSTSVTVTSVKKSALSTPQPASAAHGASADTSALSSSIANLVELCARHEARIKEVMATREAMFKKLEANMTQAAGQIRACQEKNENLTQRLTEMDKIIDDEKARWQSQIETKTITHQTTHHQRA
jgi:hypothetical protein